MHINRVWIVSARRWDMTHDQIPPRKPPDTDDNSRTEEAKRVVDDYVEGLRELLRRLRKWFS